jgi:hypothetical protein
MQYSMMPPPPLHISALRSSGGEERGRIGDEAQRRGTQCQQQ